MPDGTYDIFKPILDKLDSEKAKDHATEALLLLESYPQFIPYARWLFNDSREQFKDERLQSSIGDRAIDNPILVGAGWVKDGNALYAINRFMGFSGAVVGTILLQPQMGNDIPRMWRFQNSIDPNLEVTFNRMGFPSKGVEYVKEQLKNYERRFLDEDINFPIGVSLGKNKEMTREQIPDAHMHLVEVLRDRCSFIELNISCPNIPNPREMQNNISLLVETIEAMMHGMGDRKIPIFVKVSPDISLSELDKILQVISDYDLAGLVVANITIDPMLKRAYGVEDELGGIAGADHRYLEKTIRLTSHAYRSTMGMIQIMGSGGIYDLNSALLHIGAGAMPLQVVSGISFRGPNIANQINKGLVYFMNRHGVSDINQLRGYGRLGRSFPF